MSASVVVLAFHLNAEQRYVYYQIWWMSFHPVFLPPAQCGDDWLIQQLLPHV